MSLTAPSLHVTQHGVPGRTFSPVELVRRAVKVGEALRVRGEPPCETLRADTLQPVTSTSLLASVWQCLFIIYSRLPAVTAT